MVYVRLMSFFFFFFVCVFFFQAEDGIRDLVRSRGLGDVYKRQVVALKATTIPFPVDALPIAGLHKGRNASSVSP